MVMNEGRVCRIRNPLSRSSRMSSDDCMIAGFLWNLGLAGWCGVVCVSLLPIPRRRGEYLRVGSLLPSLATEASLHRQQTVTVEFCAAAGKPEGWCAGALLLRAQSSLQVLDKHLPRDLTLNSQLCQLFSGPIKKQERGRPEQLLFGHPGALGWGVGCDIQLDA